MLAGEDLGHSRVREVHVNIGGVLSEGGRGYSCV